MKRKERKSQDCSLESARGKKRLAGINDCKRRGKRTLKKAAFLAAKAIVVEMKVAAVVAVTVRTQQCLQARTCRQGLTFI